MNETPRSILPMAAIAAIGLALLLPSDAAAGDLNRFTRQMRNEHVQVDDLRVVETQGITILRGRATSSRDARRVERIAQAAGFERIANLIEIVRVPKDELIRSAAERRLFLARGLDGSRLRVRCSNGIVTIEGTVADSGQQELIRRVVERVEGVRQVRVRTHPLGS